MEVTPPGSRTILWAATRGRKRNLCQNSWYRVDCCGKSGHNRRDTAV